MDPRALERLDVINVDALAMRIVRSVSGPVPIMEESARRSIAGVLMKRHVLGSVFAGNESLLLEEFDAFLTGRGTTDPEAYFALRRRGGGIPLSRPEREQVWAAYQEYLRQLERSGRYDYALLRLRAAELVEQRRGERYAGVIVDEAQDITQVGIRLLVGLDTSPDHAGFMAVGDGQQSIYPGGFSLRSLGIDVRGRARVLTTNWPASSDRSWSAALG
jgi:superfamily I DNA/RNA helicase